MQKNKNRCKWANNELLILYHDNEWNFVVHSDIKLFEYLVLEIFQAGLSWNTILQKRENFRMAFDDFDYVKISKYDEKKIENLMTDKGIIRNRLKIRATINNAKVFIKIQKKYGSFNYFIWNLPKSVDVITKKLKTQGFKFIGITTIYSFMQAIGMIEGHEKNCFKKYQTSLVFFCLIKILQCLHNIYPYHHIQQLHYLLQQLFF